nr:hypothetical protein GCM10020063_097110 [Dactylosporangium thailandense]
MNHPKTRLRTWRTRAVLVGGTVTAMIAATAAPALAATVPLTLSSATGPSGGGNTITATATTNIFTTAITPVVEFQYVGTGAAASCSATYLAPAAVAGTVTGGAFVQNAGVIAATTVKKLGTSATNKIAVTVPAGVVLGSSGGTNQSTAKYNLCVYTGTTTGASGSPLIGNAAYAIAGQPTLTTVTPSTGPALGGNTITVAGTNFPSTGMTGTLGGLALSNIVVATGGTSFTATVPAHAAQTGVSLIINSAGGMATKTTAYSYTNGIVISPNTAPQNTTVDVDVQGVGFSAMDFSSSNTVGTIDTKAHVYLVPGKYDPTTNSSNKTLGGVAECGSVLVVSDTELICTMDLHDSLDDTTGAAVSGTPVPKGTYTLTVVNDGSVGAQSGTGYSVSLIVSGATFTVSDY